MGKNGNSSRFYFLELQNHCRMVTAAMKLKDTYSLKKNYDQPRQHIKKQRHYFANKVHLVKTMVLRRSQDGGGVGRGEHFLPHKFIKRAFKR